MILKSTPFAFFLCVASACASDTLDGFPTEEPIKSNKREADPASRDELVDANEEIKRLSSLLKTQTIKINTLQNTVSVLLATEKNLQEQILSLITEKRALETKAYPGTNLAASEGFWESYQKRVWQDEKCLIGLKLQNQANNKK